VKFLASSLANSGTEAACTIAWVQDLSRKCMHMNGWCLHLTVRVVPPQLGWRDGLRSIGKEGFHIFRQDWSSVWTSAVVTLAHVRKHVDVMLWPTTVSKTK